MKKMEIFPNAPNLEGYTRKLVRADHAAYVIMGRLNRWAAGSSIFGDEIHSKEELVAEIGPAFSMPIPA